MITKYLCNIAGLTTHTDFVEYLLRVD